MFERMKMNEKKREGKVTSPKPAYQEKKLSVTIPLKTIHVKKLHISSVSVRDFLILLKTEFLLLLQAFSCCPKFSIAVLVFLFLFLTFF